MQTFTGQIRTNRKGLGFFRSKEVKDFIEIQTSDLGTAFDNDIVEVEVTGKNSYGDKAGKVIKLIKRNKSVWVGVVRDVYSERGEGKERQFVPDDNRFYPKTIIDNLDAFPQLKDDEKVLMKLVDFADANSDAHLSIEKVLGKVGDNETEMKAAVYDRGLVIGFSKEVEDAANELKKKAPEMIAADMHNRKDFRHLKVCTIDPSDAKDFDDAVDIQYLEDGTFKVGVHIADPTFFVTPGSIIDNEAKERATSIYLVDRTIPMQPEVLSNDLCSLNPNEDKVAFSLVFDMDSEGNVLKEWFGKSVINSKRRFNYLEAQDVIDGKIADEGGFKKDLETLTMLADKLEAKRVKAGSIQFNSVEVKFKLDENKFPIEIYQKEHVHTMDLIEEFALLSNRQISKMAAVTNGERNKNPFIFRIHDEPKPEKVTEVIKFLEKLGRPVDSNSDGKLSAREMNKILKESKGTPEEGILSLSILRTMQKAIYGTESRGHFGLAFKYYSHFTSPIRRYSDMIAHRLALKYINGEQVSEKEVTNIQKMADHSSEMEQKAVAAERESVAFKQAQYYSVRIGEEFFGIITGVMKFGFFVENLETKAQGLVSVRNLGNDFFAFDKDSNSLKGQKSKKEFKLGDKVSAEVKSVNIDDRKIDLTLKK